MLDMFEKSSDGVRPGMPFSRLLRHLLLPELNFVKLILVNSVGISLLSLFLPISIQALITNLGILNQSQPIIIMTLVLFVVLLFSGSIQTLQAYTIEVLRRRLFIRFGGEILGRALNFQDESYNSVNRGLLGKRYTDVLLMQSSMVVFFVDGIGFGFQYVLTILLLCLYHPYFIVFGVVITALLWLSWHLFGPRGVAAGSPEADARYEVMGWVDEVLRARPVFMTKIGKSFAEKRFVELSSQWSDKRQNLFRQQFLQTIALQLINAFIYAVLIGMGYFLVRNGELSVGQLVAAFIVVTMLLSSLPRLQNFYTSIYDYSTNLDKLAEFWAIPSEVSGTHAVAPEDGLEFKLENIVFAEEVRLDLKLKAREKVYCYVESFSAARCLNRLLEGNLSFQSGELRINNQRLVDIDKGSLRERLQVIAIGRTFSASIYENLSIQQTEKPSQTQVADALEAVGLLERVTALPEGIHTRLLPNGYPLSISESLALQVARVLLSKPGLVIVTLDFDKLSPHRRARAQELLLNPASPWTVIFLTQRIDKSRFDRYVVLGRQASRDFSSIQALAAEVQNHE